MSEFNTAQTRTWGLTTSADGTFFEAEFNRLYGNDIAAIFGLGSIPKWNFTVIVGGGTSEEPDEIRWNFGALIASKLLTWVGEKVTVAEYRFDDGTGFVTLGTKTITYDGDDFVTSIVWS